MKTPAQPQHDDGLEWLRDIRRQMSAESNHDPRVYVERMREFQKQFQSRLVRVRKILEPVK